MYTKVAPKPLRFLPIICFALLIVSISTANAQRRRSAGINADGDLLGGSNHSSSSGSTAGEDGWAVALNAGYESPLGEVKELYKGAPTFGVSLIRREGNVLYSGTVDYRSYKPIQATETENGGGGEVTAHSSNYTGIGLYLGIAYQVPLGSLNVYGGVNGGFVQTKYDYSIDDGTTTYAAGSANTSTTYIAPKLGFNVPISGNISLGLEGRYSLGVVGANINSRDGGEITKGFNSYAGNAFLIYSF